VNKQEAIKALEHFIDWFEDNFLGEDYLMTIEEEDGTLREEWVPYCEHPTYTDACKALDVLKNTLTSPFNHGVVHPNIVE
jgi:hypothetical protein